MDNPEYPRAGRWNKVASLLFIGLSWFQGEALTFFPAKTSVRGESSTTVCLRRSLVDEPLPGSQASKGCGIAGRKLRSLVDEAPPGSRDNQGRSDASPNLKSIKDTPPSRAVRAPEGVFKAMPPGRLVDRITPRATSPKKHRPLISSDESSQVPNYEDEIAALNQELELRTREFNVQRLAWQAERSRLIDLISNVGRSLAMRYEEIGTLSKAVTDFSGREAELENQIRALTSEMRSEDSNFDYDRNFKLDTAGSAEAGILYENQPNVFMWVQNETDE